ncbi:MAG: B12-binding domain-containing radical SAM protein [Promethearchaeota archaeon]
MKILLIYPKYPKTFWSYSDVLKIIDKKAIFPPLGLLTVASMLPEEWEKKLVDCNVNDLTDADLIWADMVFISAMIVQKDNVYSILMRCSALNKTVVVGGPLFSAIPQDFEDMGISHFVLNEAEITLPLFLKDLEEGKAKKMYHSSERPDLKNTPIPMWSLIDFNDYYSALIQYSRGCPFNCEFCDIIVMNGRVPRTKSPKQIINELQAIYDLDFRGMVFFVDDNFIGNKKDTKLLLPKIIEWQQERDYPFNFFTESSLNLSEDTELMELMSEANFTNVFLGIETPSYDSLKECGKFQNIKIDLVESIRTIQEHGMQVMGGFILGFDKDPEDIFDAMIEYIQKTGIVTAMVGLLTALPGTRLWHRLKEEGRLIPGCTGENTDVVTNINPLMGMENLVNGYIHVLKTIYNPKNYYKRIETLLDHLKLNPTVLNWDENTSNKKKKIQYGDSMMVLRIIWEIVIKSHNRFRFLRLLVRTLRKRPELRYIAAELAIYGHHFEKNMKKVVKNKPNINNLPIPQSIPSKNTLKPTEILLV